MQVFPVLQLQEVLAMQTYKARKNVWICEIRISGHLCICEANHRAEARRGALELARQRAERRVAK